MRALAVLLLAGVLSAAGADLILHNGKIVTVDSRFSIAQAVAVSHGRIVAVGANTEILKQRGPKTAVIDLAGRTVLPGLIDSHVHVMTSALSEFRAPLPHLTSYADVQDYIRAQMKRTPKGKWIIVPRTFPTRLREMAMPTREVLDVAAEHPVMFDASYVWVVNSYALRMSAITRDTPDPRGGQIGKDDGGEPNGILRNASSLLKGIDRAQTFTDAERLAAMEAMLKRYPSAGLTSVVDRAATVHEIALFQKLRAENRIPIRTTLTYRPDSTRPVEDVVREIRNAPFRAGQGDDWLRLGVFKVTLDGGMTIGTAYQRQPYGSFGKQLYAQPDPVDRGQIFLTPEKLKAILGAANEMGWPLTAHAQGGGAIDAFLDALEAIDRERPIANSRSHLMHASFQSPEAIARTKKLGMLADVQAAWLYFDGTALEKVFSYDGMRYFFPLRSYLNAGIPIVGGSDHMVGHDKNNAVNPYNPFLGMWTAVVRKTDRGKVIHAEEKITREEALRMYTTAGAYLDFAEAKKGSIEPGKLADFVVIDRDYLTCPEDEIRRIEPVMTILDGRVVYRK